MYAAMHISIRSRHIPHRVMLVFIRELRHPIMGSLETLGLMPNNALGQYCVGDEDVMTVGGIATAGKVSPKNCASGTLGDEIKFASEFNSKTIGVSLKDRGSDIWWRTFGRWSLLVRQ